jgi:hypothetical protein
MVGLLQHEYLIFDIFELIIADSIPLETLYSKYPLSSYVFGHVDLRIVSFANFLLKCIRADLFHFNCSPMCYIID